MNKTDRKLGMDMDISRRDFLNSVSIAVGASLFPGAASAQDVGAQDVPGYYPPELTGMRGSHPGSFETAHLARDGASFATGVHSFALFTPNRTTDYYLLTGDRFPFSGPQ